MRERYCEVLIVGGGLGGQLTAQAVPPDEHDWIEERGCTSSYRRLRDGIRQYYTAAARMQ